MVGVNNLSYSPTGPVYQGVIRGDWQIATLWHLYDTGETVWLGRRTSPLERGPLGYFVRYPWGAVEVSGDAMRRWVGFGWVEQDAQVFVLTGLGRSVAAWWQEQKTLHTVVPPAPASGAAGPGEGDKSE